MYEDNLGGYTNKRFAIINNKNVMVFLLQSKNKTYNVVEIITSKKKYKEMYFINVVVNTIRMCCADMRDRREGIYISNLTSLEKGSVISEFVKKYL